MSVRSLAMFQSDQQFASPNFTLPDGDTDETGGGAGKTTEPEMVDGYPKGVGVADMTVEQQANYWKSRARKNDEDAKATRRSKKEFDDLVAERDKFKAQNQSEQERAAEAVRAEVRQAVEAEQLAKFGPQLVQTRFEALIAPRGLTPERVSTLSQHLSTSQYLKDDGSVDLVALTAFADAVAPLAAGGSSATSKTFKADLGQGKRGSEGGAGGDVATRAAAFAKSLQPGGVSGSNPL